MSNQPNTNKKTEQPVSFEITGALIVGQRPDSPDLDTSTTTPCYLLKNVKLTPIYDKEPEDEVMPLKCDNCRRGLRQGSLVHETDDGYICGSCHDRSAPSPASDKLAEAVRRQHEESASGLREEVVLALKTYDESKQSPEIEATDGRYDAFWERLRLTRDAVMQWPEWKRNALGELARKTKPDEPPQPKAERLSDGVEIIVKDIENGIPLVAVITPDIVKALKSALAREKALEEKRKLRDEAVAMLTSSLTIETIECLDKNQPCSETIIRIRRLLDIYNKAIEAVEQTERKD